MTDRARTVRRPRWPLVLLPLLPLLLAATYNIRDRMSHGSWASFMMYLGDDVLFRAAVTRGQDTFAVDSKLNTCDKFQIKVIGTLSKPSSDDTEFGSAVLIRVDDAGLHQTTGQFSAERGSTTAFLLVNRIEEGPRLFREMKYGNTIRFKVVPEGGNSSPTYMSFPLNGSAAAISRADDLCARYTNASGGGRSGGGNGGRGRNDGAPDDSDYFGGGGQPQPQPQPQPQRPKPRGDDSFF